jgi:hypothetical protein
MAIDDKLVARVDQLIAKADRVLETEKPNPPNVSGPRDLDAGAFSEWQTQSLSLLTNLLGTDHVYCNNFVNTVKRGQRWSVETGKGILRAVREDLSLGYFTKVRTLVTAEVFSDFLDMAQHLLDCGYKDPSASLIGAVLESGLRQIAQNKQVKLKSKENLASLNMKCADSNVYNRLVQKKIQVWIDIRDHADHGNFAEYSESDVSQMMSGVRDFLSSHLS